MLLAEANLWPSDVAAYFGDGDECHMAFHFPLMPRLYMALRQEDRHPISEILYQTPEIPDSCQWAIFLRNHDELTLEMVTDEERDYMYQAYAADPQMRVNAGIRRRLAPLMENSRARIELLNGLLLSLPGTPVIYYGDEIGMGDNVYLGDRNGVRTPMQWTADRNGGFSRADPARLYAPVIMDSGLRLPVRQRRGAGARRRTRCSTGCAGSSRSASAIATFGRGIARAPAPGEPPHLRVRPPARRRRSDPRRRQHVAHDAAGLARPVEVRRARADRDVGRHGPAAHRRDAVFPHARGARILLARSQASSPGTRHGAADRAHAQPSSSRCPCSSAKTGRARSAARKSLLERRYLASFLRRQRWFQKRAHAMTDARLADWTTLRGGKEPVMVDARDREVRRRLAGDRTSCRWRWRRAREPTRSSSIRPDGVLARIAGATRGVLHGLLDPEVAGELFAAIAGNRTFDLRHGQLVASRTAAFDDIRTQAPDADLTPVTPSIERANSTIRFGERYVLKLIRRVWPGPSHEVEMDRFLTERAHFTRAPRLAGTIELGSGPGDRAVAAVLHAFVPHQMDGWRQALGELERYFESAVAWDAAQARLDQPVELANAEIPEAARTTVGGALESASTLGRRTAELHLALAGELAAAEFGTALTDAGVDRRARRPRETSGRGDAGSACSAAPPGASRRSIDALPASRDRADDGHRRARPPCTSGPAAHAHSRRVRPRAGPSERGRLRHHRLRGRPRVCRWKNAAGSTRR